MARPIKAGMDYFPHDTDSHSDIKIQKLIVYHGIEGYGVYFYLLEKLYRQGELALDFKCEMTRLLLAKGCNLPIQTFEKIVQSCVQVELFCQQAWKKHKRITSRGVAKRVERVEKERERKRKDKQPAPVDSPVIPPIIDGENPDNVDKVGVIDGENPQRKEKKSKVNIDKEHDDKTVLNARARDGELERKKDLFFKHLNSYGAQFNDLLADDFDTTKAVYVMETLCPILTDKEIRKITIPEFRHLLYVYSHIRLAKDPMKYAIKTLADFRGDPMHKDLQDRKDAIDRSIATRRGEL